MNHKDIGNEDSGRGNIYFDRWKVSDQCQKKQTYSFVLSVTDDRRGDHQLTQEEIISCDQSEKLLYTAMKN